MEKIIFFFLELAIINSYILSKIVAPITHLQFRLDLATQLIEKFPFPLPTPSPANKRKNSVSEPNISIDTSLTAPISYKRIKVESLSTQRLEHGNHFPVCVGSKGRKDCKVCTLKNIRSGTPFNCSLCNVYLCIKEDSTCWSDWHTKAKF